MTRPEHVIKLLYLNKVVVMTNRKKRQIEEIIDRRQAVLYRKMQKKIKRLTKRYANDEWRKLLASWPELECLRPHVIK